MKLRILIALLPTLLLAQGVPDTENSKLWQMRKKTQQRSAQRTGTYLEQMNQALQAGDAESADTAMKAAIAQGTLTQVQINEARGRIDAMVSQQQQVMVAEARGQTAGDGVVVVVDVSGEFEAVVGFEAQIGGEEDFDAVGTADALFGGGAVGEHEIVSDAVEAKMEVRFVPEGAELGGRWCA